MTAWSAALATHPDTSAGKAVLGSAAGPDTVANVKEILASSGVRSTRQGHRR